MEWTSGRGQTDGAFSNSKPQPSEIFTEQELQLDGAAIFVWLVNRIAPGLKDLTRLCQTSESSCRLLVALVPPSAVTTVWLHLTAELQGLQRALGTCQRLKHPNVVEQLHSFTIDYSMSGIGGFIKKRWELEVQ
eukprot:1155106-Pelagomonas_calceolata.AAC.11